MSDSYVIICTEKVVSDPIELGEKLIRWLQSQGVIETSQSDCVLDSKKLGYKPGRSFMKAVEEDSFLNLEVCGLELMPERQVFHGMSLTNINQVKCPSCNRNRFEGFKPQEFYPESQTDEQRKSFEAVYDQFDHWVNGLDTNLTCPHCGVNSKIDDYQIEENIGLSNLGFRFWNWPSLRPRFIEQVEPILGTEIKLIYGRL